MNVDSPALNRPGNPGLHSSDLREEKADGITDKILCGSAGTGSAAGAGPDEDPIRGPKRTVARDYTRRGDRYAVPPSHRLQALLEAPILLPRSRRVAPQSHMLHRAYLKIGFHDILEMRQKLDSIEINGLPSCFGNLRLRMVILR